VGLQLDALVLADYSGEDLAFLGMMPGTPFTIDPTDPPASILPRLLGWVHMHAGLIGTDLFPTMASQFGVIGFTAPLPAGDYSFWIQEASAVAANYSLRFDVSAVPEPSTLALTGLVVTLGAVRRRMRAGRVSKG
jgi:hypothetical protein